jgi:hypothetical protein
MSRPDSAAWLAAKKAGDETERLVADWLLSRGADVLRYEGRANADLEARWRFECKHDRMALNSGKVAIEIAYAGSPSGICTTEAAHWFVHVGDEVFMLETRVLRGLVEARPFDTVAAGDGKRAQVKLVPVADLRRIARATIRVRRTA